MVRDLFRSEAAGSIILILVSLLAVICANSPIHPYYNSLNIPDIKLFINDGLMTFFFLVIGIEIRHEMEHGSLSNRRQIWLPLIAALGGVLLPALIYISLNPLSPWAKGWGVPTATDIAFALGVLAFFGNRIPSALRIFLMMVAIFDDIAAVLIISIFYSNNLSASALALAALCMVLLYIYQHKVTRKPPYFFISLALWVAMLDSGIHASLAGIIIGLLLPEHIRTPLFNRLRSLVTFGVVPIFAFANAGVPIDEITLSKLTSPLSMGIILGLFLGKQLGIFSAAWMAIRANLATLPTGTNWSQFYAVCVIAGIGFTMSLFIGSLAFPTDSMILGARIGVLIGSLASAATGAILLLLVSPSKKDSG